MNHQKQLLTIFSLSLIVFVSVAAIRPTYKNLKVLPQDISERKLDSIMHSYNQALGVNCEFCHAKKGYSLEFDSDENKMKDNARDMMRLTIDINRMYFRYDTIVNPVYLNTVACYTCHRGTELPPDIKKLKIEEKEQKKPLFPFGGK
jgi:transcriptional regulator of met regulon